MRRAGSFGVWSVNASFPPSGAGLSNGKLALLWGGVAKCELTFRLVGEGSEITGNICICVCVCPPPADFSAAGCTCSFLSSFTSPVS